MKKKKLIINILLVQKQIGKKLTMQHRHYRQLLELFFVFSSSKIVKQPNCQKVELHNATKTSTDQNEIAKFCIIDLIFVASLSF